MKFSIPLTFVLHAATVAAQGKCDHYTNEVCVDAYGSTSFEFKPLFSSSLTFAYGFRVYFENEISNSLSGRPINYRGDVNGAKAWLEYSNDTLNIDVSTNRTTTFATLLTNATGNVSGGSNGCEGLLGNDCVKNLKDVLTWAVVLSRKSVRAVFSENVGKFHRTPLTNLSCPAGIFDNYGDLSINFVADEYVPDELALGNQQPSGNASKPWISDLQYHSSEEFINYAAIGIIARYPMFTARRFEDVQLDLVCVRPKPVEGSGDRIEASKIKPTPDGADPGKSDGAAGSVASATRRWTLLMLLPAILIPCFSFGV